MTAPASTAPPTHRVRQAIFQSVAATTGARVVFASLTDGRCALLLDDRLVAAWGNDPEHVNHWGRRDFFEFIGDRFEIVETPLVFPWTMALATVRA